LGPGVAEVAILHEGAKQFIFSAMRFFVRHLPVFPLPSLLPRGPLLRFAR
jgi:hypothetical protein